MRIPKAKKACDDEWSKLLNAGPKGCFDMSKNEEKWMCEKKAKETRENVHFGRISELCYEKNSELPDNDERKTYKGRDCFLGDQVKDQEGNVALFQDLSSSPATNFAPKGAAKCSASSMKSKLCGFKIRAHCLCI